MLGSSRVAAQLAASREGLGSMSDEEYAWGENLGVGERMILKCLLFLNEAESWALDLFDSEYRTASKIYEDENEFAGSRKGREFLDQLSNYLVPQKDIARWS
jgi:hypothetical protein